MNTVVAVSPPTLDDSASHETPLMLILVLIGAALLYAACRLVRDKRDHHRYHR